MRKLTKKSKKRLLFSIGSLLLLALSWMFSPRFRSILLNLWNRLTKKSNDVAILMQNYLIAKDFKKPEKIIAVAKHETGVFTSRLFQEQNNLFGMRMPRIRSTLAIKEENNYATFKNWKDSLNDWFLWWNFHGISQKRLDELSVEKMVSLMKKWSYFEAPEKDYLKAVKSLM